MNVIKRTLLLICLTGCIFIACSQNNMNKKMSGDKGEVQLSDEKQQIKAFWEAYRKAQKYRVEGKWEKAAGNYEKALELDKNHEDARFNLGNMYLELDQYKKAEACWRKIVETNPSSARAHMQLGRLYLSYERPETFDIGRAKEEFTKTLKLNKVITGPSLLLGHVALLEGNNDEAMDYFQSVTGSDIKNVEAYFLQGYLFWKTGNNYKAGQLFEKAVKNAVPEKAIKNVLSEGDTEGGKSHLRPVNDSLFIEFFRGLDTVKTDDYESEMNARYRNLDAKLKEIKTTIRS